MARILVVEDDGSTRKLVCAVLRRAGFDTSAVSNAEEAFDELEKTHVDLIVTDVMMPGMDGFSLIEALRDARYDLPIVVMTAKGRAEDVRQGFLVGTDDYVVKPVDAQELVLRCRALMRRAKIVADRQIRIGDVTVDYDTLSVSRGEGRVTLPPKEFYLLYKLLSYPDRAFTRLQLFEEIWGLDSESDSVTVAVHVNRLRARFRDWKEFDIVTVRGVGYRAVRHDGREIDG